jgi:MerR family transcriptional regulator, copper efflux regulator
MRIGELARRAGVHIQTVRYYERRGVLGAPLRLPSGYRDYDEDAVGEIALVRWGQTLGFTLREIRDLRRLTARDRLRQRAAAKLGEIDGRLRALRRTRRQLEALVRCRCEGACPILRRARRPPARPRRNHG